MSQAGGKPPGGDDREIDVRSVEVLRAVIREHIAHGEPVGSKTVSRGRIDLSPASIRNIMAALEERGFLAQPHTSAGRIPTDKAYRLYVDQMIRRPRVAPAQAEAISHALQQRGAEVVEMLAEASRQLSHFSHNVGVVLAPEMSRVIVDHMEFVRLDPRRVVAILVGRAGVVHNRILEVDEPLSQMELDRVGRYLSEELGGRTLRQMRALLLAKLKEERAAFDRLMARSLELGRQAIESKTAETEVYVEGASNLIGSRDFSDLEAMRAMMQTLEERRKLVGLLSRVLEGQGVQVVIGEENPDTDRARCSLVAASYGVGERVLGTLGIVGPTRMEYARAIALVEYLADLLTRRLTTEEN